MARNSTTNIELAMQGDAPLHDRFNAARARREAGRTLMSWEEQWLEDIEECIADELARTSMLDALRAALEWIEAMRIIPGGQRDQLRNKLRTAIARGERRDA